MAYISQQIPDEEKNKFASANETTPNPIPAQTGGSAGVEAGGKGAAPGVGTPTQFGSNAARLSDYLKANQSQVGQFGQKVGNSLTDSYNQTMGNINQGFNNFNNQVNQGYQNPTSDQINQATTNPTEFVKNPENVSSFQNWWSGNYSGPQNVESQDFYSNVNNDVNKAVEQSNLAGSNNMSGLSSYLRSSGGSKTSAPGTQMLDAALLQRSPEARNSIQSAAAPFKGLNDFLTNKVASGNDAVKSAKEKVGATSQDLQNQFNGKGGIIPTFEGNLNNARTQKIQETNDAIQKALKDAKEGNLSFDELSMFGDPFDAQGINEAARYSKNLQSDYGVSFPLENYFTAENPELMYGNPRSVANPDQIAYGQALQQLTGQPVEDFMGQETKMPSQLINYDKNAIGDPQKQLSSKDEQTVTGVFSGMGGFPNIQLMSLTNPDLYTRENLKRMATESGATGRSLDVFMNAAERLGLISDYTTPTDTSGGPENGIMKSQPTGAVVPGPAETETAAPIVEPEIKDTGQLNDVGDWAEDFKNKANKNGFGRWAKF